MKNLFFLTIILVIAVSASAQKKVGGFYKGTLFNDSTKMIQQYELALAEYRGKIMGYSYVTFIANDTFYYGIKKIKAKIEGDSLIVEDDKMIANNFPEAPAKHVSRTVVIPFHGQDSLISVNGRWRTNRTKTYYSVPGSVVATKSNDSSSSALFAHLKELNLMPDNNDAATETLPKEKESKVKTQNQPSVADIKVKEKKRKAKAKKSPAVENKIRLEEKETKIKAKTEPAAQKSEPSELPYNQRKEHLHQTIDVSSDSLILSFYDNGVVDGDSISVYLNDEPVVAHALLKSVATKKTVYIGGMNEVKLVLVADNLGSIPPNTGLLVIQDGNKNYQVNFTADMQTNASIVLRRKKN